MSHYYHVYVHDAFDPQKHPHAGKGAPGGTGGQFTKGSGGGGSSGPKNLKLAKGKGGYRARGTTRPISQAKPRGVKAAVSRHAGRVARPVRRVASGTVKFGRELGHEFGQEDAEIITKVIKPGSPERRSTANAIRDIATTLPNFIKSHGKEEAKKYAGASRALYSMANRQTPTPEDSYNLKKASLSVGLIAITSALVGDPTGTVGHAAAAGTEAAIMGMHHVLHTIIEHTVMEHTLAFLAGTVKFGVKQFKRNTKPTPHPRDAGSDDINYVLLQEFLQRLAKNIETKGVPNFNIENALKAQFKPG